MTVQTFIKQNRRKIDTIVKRYYNVDIVNDRERHEWILSDEGLFRWAHHEGVNI